MTELERLAARVEAATAHPAPSRLDECECGDYRRDHPKDGPCAFNGPHFDLTHGGQNCMKFVRARSKEQADG